MSLQLNSTLNLYNPEIFTIKAKQSPEFQSPRQIAWKYERHSVKADILKDDVWIKFLYYCRGRLDMDSFVTNIFDVRKLFLAYLAANINKISNFADAGRLAEARSRAMREGRRT